MMGSFLFYTTHSKLPKSRFLAECLQHPCPLGGMTMRCTQEAPVGIELQVPDNHPALTSFPLSLLHFSTCVSWDSLPSKLLTRKSVSHGQLLGECKRRQAHHSLRFEMYLGLCEARPFHSHSIHPPFCLVSDLWIMHKLLGSTQIHRGACTLAKPVLRLCWLRQSTNSVGRFAGARPHSDTTETPWLF